MGYQKPAALAPIRYRNCQSDPRIQLASRVSGCVHNKHYFGCTEDFLKSRVFKDTTGLCKVFCPEHLKARTGNGDSPEEEKPEEPEQLERKMILFCLGIKPRFSDFLVEIVES